MRGYVNGRLLMPNLSADPRRQGRRSAIQIDNNVCHEQKPVYHLARA